MQDQIKSIIISLVILIPSPLLILFLKDNTLPMQHPMIVAYAVLILACLDFVSVVLIERYRGKDSRLTMAALLSMILVIFLFILTESLQRIVNEFGYEWLTPLVAMATFFIYVAIFREKNIPLKLHLSLNSIVLGILWIVGSADKITMPF